MGDVVARPGRQSDKIPIPVQKGPAELSTYKGRARQGSSPMSLAESSEGSGANTPPSAVAIGKSPVLSSRNGSELSARGGAKSLTGSTTGSGSRRAREVSVPELSHLPRAQLLDYSRIRHSETTSSSRQQPAHGGRSSLSGSGKALGAAAAQGAVAESKPGRRPSPEKSRGPALVSIEDMRNAADARAVKGMLVQCPTSWAKNIAYAASLLEIAAKRGNKDLIKWLQKHGADFDAVNREYTLQNKVTPILTAAMFSHRNTARTLARQGLRSTLSEMANSSPEVLEILLACSGDVITDSRAAGEKVILELVARKHKLAERPLESDQCFFDSRKTLEKIAEQQAVYSFLLLFRVGAVVTAEAMLKAIVGGQAQLAWTMLNSYMANMPLEEVWADPQTGWLVMSVAISLGQKEHITDLLLQKQQNSWAQPEATQALEFARTLMEDECVEGFTHIIIPPPPNNSLFERLSIRSEIHRLMLADKRLADREYKLQQARERDYMPGYGKNQASEW